ncbi:TrbC/VirB2 family protein [Candidatus Woesearchaeota archaeon]|nr:TrbC/VirB2 family protein [Candidatus Woesearchaeota archaeon]
MNKRNVLSCIVALVLMILPLAYSVHAVEITPPSGDDINSFNQILEPVMKVYNFVKYASSVLALLFIIFAAVQMFINNNPSEKEQAKAKVMYIVIGLGLIWVAPIIVNYLTAS